MSEWVLYSFSNHGHGDSDARLAAETSKEQTDDSHPNVEGKTENHDAEYCHSPAYNHRKFSSIIVSDIENDNISKENPYVKSHTKSA